MHKDASTGRHWLGVGVYDLGASPARPADCSAVATRENYWLGCVPSLLLLGRRDPRLRPLPRPTMLLLQQMASLALNHLARNVQLVLRDAEQHRRVDLPELGLDDVPEAVELSLLRLHRVQELAVVEQDLGPEMVPDAEVQLVELGAPAGLLSEVDQHFRRLRRDLVVGVVRDAVRADRAAGARGYRTGGVCEAFPVPRQGEDYVVYMLLKAGKPSA